MVFRGSAARAAGLVTAGALRGPRYTRVFPDVYVSAAHAAGRDAEELRARAAAALVDGRGVLAGYAAALLHGVDCGGPGALADVILRRGGIRPREGLVLHRDRIAAGEIAALDGGTLVTTLLRTAFDLVRWATEQDEAVVALDALARHGGFEPAEVLTLAERYPRARGITRLPGVVALADHRSGSPAETRLRLALVRAGLPRPEVRWMVQDPVAQRAIWLDLAYPAQRVGLEYYPDRAGPARPGPARLTAAGWRLFRFTPADPPERIAALVRTAASIGAAGW